MKSPWIVAALLALTAPAFAQERATRAELALTYVEFEAALAAHPPADGAARSRINQAFDQATLAFFAGAGERAIVTLRRQALALRGAPVTTPLTHLRARVDPPVWKLGSRAPSVRLSLFPGAPRGEGVRLELRRVGEQHAATSWAVDTPRLLRDGKLELALDRPTVGPGTYHVVATRDGAALTVGRWTVLRRLPSQLRAELTARTEALTPAEPALLRARRTCLDRIQQLLTDTPSETSTAQFLADLPALCEALPREVAALEAGRDPYRRKVGTLWRPLRSGKQTVALRVHAPPAARSERVPLLIALHGAGGDENMFAWGYGGGALLRLADAKGFLVATPRTEAVMTGGGKLFDALLAELEDDYAVDRRRVYLVGHSMGVMVGQGLLAQRGRDVAGAVFFAGTPRAGGGAPVLALLGAQDPLLRFGNRQLPKGPGLTVRRLEGYGHTLIVGDELPGALDWLLSREPNRRWH